MHRMAWSHPMNPASPTPNADKPRGINWAIQQGKPQISKNKLQITSLSLNVPRLKNSGTSLVGDKTQIPNPDVQ